MKFVQKKLRKSLVDTEYVRNFALALGKELNQCFIDSPTIKFAKANYSRGVAQSG